MALIGAITRLTESGLSITEWNPVMGALPPLNDAAWDKAFHNYQQIPQYQILHRGMTLDEFKGIFFWEWLHRLWGRMIGVVFGLPLLFFWLRKKIDNKLALKLFAIFALGGLQGFIGWFMVQSGLETRTSVSPYRLAMHLGLALLVYALILWTALGRTNIARTPTTWCLRRHGWIALGFLIITMIWGAFVAGLHAGEAYNTWPLMEGDVLPNAAFTIIPKWLNVFENLALVQFIHRWLGPTTALILLSWVYRLLRTNPAEKFWPTTLGTMAIAQVMLGISTLLTHVNILLATLHQAGAITLLSLLLVNLYRLEKA
jgi:cytochrome c oxidase assembly protein subunit 15